MTKNFDDMIEQLKKSIKEQETRLSRIQIQEADEMLKENGFKIKD